MALFDQPLFMPLQSVLATRRDASTPKALRSQDVRAVVAVLSESTALVLPEQMTEQAIGRIGSIVQQERVVPLVRSVRTR